LSGKIVFKDRADAGKKLARLLKKYAGLSSVVFALPRGGVVVGHRVATKLGIPMDIIVARKIGAPQNPELGIGAISENRIQVLDTEMIRGLDLSKNDVARIIRKETLELNRRIKVYRKGRQLKSLKGKTVLLVDDGIATGGTAKAAILSLQKLRPDRIVCAVPVCALDTAQEIRNIVSALVCLDYPKDLQAIGFYYKDFKEVTDREVLGLLETA